MLTLNNVKFTENGTKIIYDYSCHDSIKKYFSNEHLFYAKYNDDVSNVPLSILIIPFLSNVLPISWFANFDIEVPELDADFNNAILKVKDEFKKQFTEYELLGNLNSKKIITNYINGNKTAMLFSGGVDAYATYIRTYKQTPELITILGADIEIEDVLQWKSFTSFIENESLLKTNRKEYIETNVRKFYTYQVELLLKDIGWWGKVQHGLSLIGSIAPISYLNSYKNIYIASSYTKEIDIAWGSTPQIDEAISWAGIQVHHDGYELKRQDKVDLITKFSHETHNEFKLRVCYSELKTEFNCSKCEKCYRTILGIILNGENPNNYGFKVDSNIYNDIFRLLNNNSASRGMQYFWWELMEKAKKSDSIYYFENQKNENLWIDKIRNGKIHEILDKKINNPKKNIYRIKFVLRNKFNTIYQLYKKIRYN